MLQCFYLLNQPRRCLAALEQRGFLSAHNTQLLSDALLTVADIPVYGNESDAGPLSGSKYTDLVAAFQLAARCLFPLDEYEDFVTLLGPLISLDVGKTMKIIFSSAAQQQSREQKNIPAFY